MCNLRFYLKNIFDLYGSFLTLSSLFLIYLLRNQKFDSELATTIMVSATASFIALLIQHIFKQIQITNNFHFLKGKYTCFSFVDPNNPNRDELQLNGSSSVIKYIEIID